MAGLKVGDRVDVTRTEAVHLAVERATQAAAPDDFPASAHRVGAVRVGQPVQRQDDAIHWTDDGRGTDQPRRDDVRRSLRQDWSLQDRRRLCAPGDAVRARPGRPIRVLPLTPPRLMLPIVTINWLNVSNFIRRHGALPSAIARCSAPYRGWLGRPPPNTPHPRVFRVSAAIECSVAVRRRAWPSGTSDSIVRQNGRNQGLRIDFTWINRSTSRCQRKAPIASRASLRTGGARPPEWGTTSASSRC
jgi:hypothetical protein